MSSIDLRDMKMFLGVMWPGLEVPRPCVYCHFDSDARISTRALMRVCTHVECAVAYDGRTLPKSEFRVRGVGRIRDGEQVARELLCFDVNVLIDCGYGTEFLSAVSERSKWSMFILCDEEEEVIHFSVTQKGIVTARSLVGRDQLSFIRDPNIQLQ